MLNRNHYSLILAVILLLPVTLSAGMIRKDGARIPRGYSLPESEQRSFATGEYRLELYARSFSQGNAVYLEVVPLEEPGEPVVYFRGKRLPLTKKEWGYRGLFPLGPNLKKGNYPLLIKYDYREKAVSYRFNLEVSDTAFHHYKKPLYFGKYSNMSYLQKPEVIRRIKEEKIKKGKAFSIDSEDKLEKGRSHPRDMHYITSPFWASRTLYVYSVKNGKKVREKNRIRVHRGLDLRGVKGTPVYALADGEVVMAEELFYEGNFVLIDHGNRVFTYYMHLDSIDVKKGDRVRAGELVARVGSTGVSTASHLHVSFIIRGVQVDPLSILPLPFRD